MKRQHLASFYFSLWVDYERLGVTRAIEQGIVEKDVCKESTFLFSLFNVFDRRWAERDFSTKKWFFISRINLKHNGTNVRWAKKLVLNIEYSLYAPEVIESRPITSDLRYILSSNILPSTCAIIFLNNVFSQILVFELNLRAFHRLDVFRIRLDNWRFGQHCWFDKIAPIPFRIWKSPS